MKRQPDELGRALHDALAQPPSPDVAERHTRAIRAAAQAAGPVAAGAATGSSWARFSTRRRIAAGAFVAVLAMPGVAVAAEDALPGDLLYPVKLAAEVFRGLFDPSVAARHRLDEYEALIGASDDDTLADARARAHDAVAGTGSAELAARLDELESSHARSDHDDDSDGDASDASPTPAVTAAPSPTPTEAPTDDEHEGDDDPSRPGATGPTAPTPSPTGAPSVDDDESDHEDDEHHGATAEPTEATSDTDDHESESDEPEEATASPSESSEPDDDATASPSESSEPDDDATASPSDSNEPDDD